MTVTLQRESTEYVYTGVTGDLPDTAEVTFLAAGSRPAEADWFAATLVPDDTHALWNDASGSGVTGDYYIARLVGAYNANDLVLSAGDYQLWLRLTGPSEQPVRIAPEAVTVQ